MRRSWVAVLLLVGACTGPVRSSDVYESKAGQTAATAASAVQTAALAVDAAKGDKAFGRYLTQLLVEAEEDAGSAQGTFDGIRATLFLEPRGVEPGHLSQVALPTLLVLGKLGLGGRGGDHPADGPDQGGELIAMAGRTLEAALQLLDRQLVDADGRLAGKVDDLELTFPDGGGPPLVTAILAGPGALSRRVGGRLGAWLEAVANRLREGDDRHPARVPFSAVTEIGSAIRLRVAKAELETDRLEAWTRDRIIGKLPGAGHAPD
jgi:sporulation protein YlmC with PRC-barrel domain